MTRHALTTLLFLLAAAVAPAQDDAPTYLICVNPRPKLERDEWAGGLETKRPQQL